MSKMRQLTDDMVLEILVRLPCYKIAIKCTCVCKQWFTIISHHTFATRFLHHHQSKDNMLPTTTTTKRGRVESDENNNKMVKKRKMSIPNHNNKHHHQVFLIHDDEKNRVLWYMSGPCCKGLNFSVSRLPFSEGANLYMVAACNDLILFMSRGSGLPITILYPREPYVIYNPLTRQRNWLPPPPKDMPLCPTIELICEPNADDGSYRYWVVFFDGEDATTEELEVRMYSSSTRKWSRFFVSSPRPMRERYARSSFVVGRKVYTYSPTTGILGFDPWMIDDGKEKQVIEGHFIEWPRTLFKRKYLETNIAVQPCSDNGSLLLSELDFMYTTTPTLRVWSLDKCKNGGDWFLKHDVRLKLLKNYDSCFTSRNRLVVSSLGFTLMELIGFHQTNDDIVYLIVGDRIIVMCNLGRGSMKVVGRIPPNDGCLIWCWTSLPLWPTPLLETIHLP